MLIRDRRPFVAGLLATTAWALLAGGAKAEIIVTQSTVMQTGDPQVSIDFQISLEPGTYLSPNDYITLSNIPDLNPTSVANYVYMIGNTDYSQYFDAPVLTVNNDGIGSLTLTYKEPPPPGLSDPIGSPGDLSIGDLYVVTTIPNPLNDLSEFNSITYSSQSHTNTGSIQSVANVSVVPEPASLGLIGIGLASAYLIARRRRRTAVRA